MKISIITTITNPDKNQYAWQEAIRSYLALADEVIVVNGGKSIDNYPVHYEKLEEGFEARDVKEILLPWPNKWHWSELPVHLNAGLEAATGDWVIKCDIDYIFHEADIPTIIYALENPAKNYAVASFVKKVIVNRHGHYRKCNLPIAINKRIMGDTIKFGIDLDERTDWCFPILVNKSIPPKYGKVPRGKSVMNNMVFDTEVSAWNYDAFFRTKEVQRREFWRFAQAYATAFDKIWGSTIDESFQYWINMMRGRVVRKLYPLAIDSHPKFIRERVRNLKPEEFGFDNWNKLEGLWTTKVKKSK